MIQVTCDLENKMYPWKSLKIIAFFFFLTQKIDKFFGTLRYCHTLIQIMN